MAFDLVIPAHDEQHRIDRTLAAYRAGFPQGDVRFHVALDGCHDGTAEVVARHAAADARVRRHEFPKLGKGGVLMETFRRCDADLVGFVDADSATPPAEMARLTQLAQAGDGVIASRRLPASVTPGRRARGRNVTSAGFAWLVRRAFDLPYSDTQCGAKVLHRRVLERVLPLLSSRDFLFDVDLLVTARRTGFEIAEVPTVWIDQAGSKLDARRDAVRMLAGAARLWFHHHAMPVDVEAQPAGDRAVAAHARHGTAATPTRVAHPVDRRPADARPADPRPAERHTAVREPVGREPVDREPVGREPVDREPVDREVPAHAA
jgi:glycosyltransferase involved in cell wall biosynthesis